MRATEFKISLSAINSECLKLIKGGEHKFVAVDNQIGSS